jgi:hypothetical protein
VLEKATQFEFGGIRPLACQKTPLGLPKNACDLDLLQHCRSNFAARI